MFFSSHIDRPLGCFAGGEMAQLLRPLEIAVRPFVIEVAIDLDFDDPTAPSIVLPQMVFEQFNVTFTHCCFVLLAKIAQGIMQIFWLEVSPRIAIS